MAMTTTNDDDNDDDDDDDEDGGEIFFAHIHLYGVFIQKFQTIACQYNRIGSFRRDRTE